MKGSESILSGRFNDPYGRPGDSFRTGRLPDNPGELACMRFSRQYYPREHHGVLKPLTSKPARLSILLCLTPDLLCLTPDDGEFA